MSEPNTNSVHTTVIHFAAPIVFASMHKHPAAFTIAKRVIVIQQSGKVLTDAVQADCARRLKCTHGYT
jgi:hypothetical protein